MKKFLKKIFYLLERLSAKPKVGGFQISDSVLQYVLIDKELKVFSLRLPPGIVKEGKVIDVNQFLDLLHQFHKMIDPDRNDRTIPIIVSLPTALIYTQSFVVPNVGSDHLEESAFLNLQMISPIPKELSYMSWEIIGVSEDQYELLGAFVEKSVVDQFKSFLEQANFSPMVFEFPGLALTRMAGYVLSASANPVLIFQISSDGLELFIIRNGSLYFDYFRSWRSIQGESREIPKSLFEQVVGEEVQKVINFTLSRFHENLSRVLLVAPGFERDIEEFLEKRFNLRVEPLELKAWSLNSSWYPSLGSALRGIIDRKEDKFISLFDLSPVEIFYREHLLDFIWLWKNIVIGVMVLFLIFFSGSAYFLVSNVNNVNQRLEGFKVQPYQQELAVLSEKAVEFNRLVKMVSVVKSSAPPWHFLVNQLEFLALQHNVIIDRLEINSITEPVFLLAHSLPSKLKTFTDALYKESSFSEINLPATAITPVSNGLFSFRVEFKYKVPANVNNLQ
ncbi:MAG: hypothetical protein QMD50_02155 [Patescibacteria group bacterium]|nr:hypothetical protein [Patescibacteria group bacterium]